MSNPRLILAGGSGFLGKALSEYFKDRFTVIILTRNPVNKNDEKWDGESFGPWTELIDGAFALVNLAGRTVDCRYNEKNKKQIIDSRIKSTSILGKAVSMAVNKPEYWINSSTATFYKDTRGNLPANTEKEGVSGDDFSMNVAQKWEETFFSFKFDEVTQIAIRTSIALGSSGGAFPVMKKIGKFGLCSPQGSGEQWISWIHIDDFCRAIDFLLEKGGNGVYNLSTPNYLKNKTFNLILKNHLRPLMTLPQPEWLLKIGAFFMQTETELILKSRKVHPQRLINEGFEFKYPTFEEALKAL